MTNNERRLLTLIRESEKPEQALLSAHIIFGTVLEQLQAYQAPLVEPQQEQA